MLIAASIFVVLATIADWWTTQRGVRKYGFREANPVARFLNEKLGGRWWLSALVLDLVLLGGFSWGLIAIGCSLNTVAAFLAIAGAVQSAAAIANYRLLRRAALKARESYLDGFGEEKE
jgi:hypothetical protein